MQSTELRKSRAEQISASQVALTQLFTASQTFPCDCNVLSSGFSIIARISLISGDGKRLFQHENQPNPVHFQFQSEFFVPCQIC